jgi:hypothetical protein
MRRIGLAVILAVSFTLAPITARAQQAGKVHRIGYLSPAQSRTLIEDFLDRELNKLGYVEGQNLGGSTRAGRWRIGKAEC